MEELANRWNNLSLSTREKSSYILPKDHRSRQFILAKNFSQSDSSRWRQLHKPPNKSGALQMLSKSSIVATIGYMMSLIDS